MPWVKLFNFRASSTFGGFDTAEGANETYVLFDDVYPTTRKAVTFGAISGAAQARDRNSGIDRRLAGVHFTDPGSPVSFRVDLPAAGDYLINLALGDHDLERADGLVVLRDDTTPRITIDHTTGFTVSTDRWRDASDALLDDEDAGAGPYGTSVTVPFATTTLILISGSATRPGWVAHMRVAQVEAGGEPPVAGGSYQQTIIRTRGYGRWQ
jgi:hypothetical protein